MEKSISIIIPTLNEAAILEDSLKYLESIKLSSDIIIADGNSEDETIQIAQSFEQVSIVKCKFRGRGYQMNQGAKQAKNDWLLFLHADSYPPADAAFLISQLFQDGDTLAGAFALRFDWDHPGLRPLEAASKWNWIISTYGDQGLIVRKNIFQAINGFKPMPILEDIEIQYRLRGRGKFQKIQTPVMTSARRFKDNGILFQLILNTALVIGWYLGVPPRILKKCYKYSTQKHKLK